MASLKLVLIFTLSVVYCHAFPELQASAQKVVKINEHEKTKNILIIKKTHLNSDGHDDLGKASSESKSNEHSKEGSKEASKEGSKEASKEGSNEGSGEDGPAGTLAHIGGHGHGVSQGGSCVNPAPEPLELYHRFASLMVTHRMFVLSSSVHYADQASLVLTGENFNNEDAHKACLRVMFEEDRRRLEGYGETSILSCATGDVMDLTCFKKENPDSTLRITYVWSDGRSVVLAIMCANGRGSWAVLSNQRWMDEHTKETILQIVDSYGFDPEDVVDYSLSEDDCASSVSSAHQEGHCVESDNEIETIPHYQLSKVKDIMRKGVYTPFSSYANAYATGMFIRGSPIKAGEDLDKICPKDIWSLSNGEIERQGFKNQDAFLECDFKDFAHIDCYPNEDKADEGSSGIIYNKNIHPIWTDGKEYVLTYNCLSTRYRTWSLYSTSKEPLEHDTRELILSKIADYGFDTAKAYEADYEHCKN